jgi:hypothetical protein
MAKVIKAEPVEIDRGTALRLWFGILLPPVAWATQLQVLWLTSEYGCATSDFFWNHVVSVSALIASLVGLYFAYREWSAVGGGMDDDDATINSRRSFMALIGMLTGALFTVIIFAQWLPTLTGVPCDK